MKVNTITKIIYPWTDDGSCVDYPNPKYASYSKCVEAELREKILPALGCMVPWMTKKDQCSRQSQRSFSTGHSNEVSILGLGSKQQQI